MQNLAAAQLTQICRNVFRKWGVPEAEAEIVTQSMVDANRVGHDSHGVIHLPKYVRELEAGLIQPGAPLKTMHESASIAVLDGHWGFGPVIATRAVEIAMQKAKQTDVSTVAVSRCNEVGRLGGYARLAADAGMIGLLMANDHGGGTCVAPHGGTEGRLSTNPIACAVPICGKQTIVLDMATSVVASGKMRLKQHKGEALPTEWCVNADSEVLVPFGGYKGFGLSIIVDILAGALSGAGCSRSRDARVGNGLFVMVLNIASFREFPGFSAEIERFIAYLKSEKRADIRVPGERGFQEQRKREKEGIPIDAETWRQIQEAVNDAPVSG